MAKTYIFPGLVGRCWKGAHGIFRISLESLHNLESRWCFFSHVLVYHGPFIRHQNREWLAFSFLHHLLSPQCKNKCSGLAMFSCSKPTHQRVKASIAKPEIFSAKKQQKYLEESKAPKHKLLAFSKPIVVDTSSWKKVENTIF